MAQQKAVVLPAEEPEVLAEEPQDLVEELHDLVDELQPGTKLLKGQYTIVRYINSGGFGITYLAKDSLDRNVVIKECFPSSFCRRSKTMVAARSRAHTAELRSVIQLFVREARHLSKIVHPNIVAVHQVFEDNGTAYMAIDYVNGLDLQQIIEGQGTMPGPAEIVALTRKLLGAVGFIHANDMLHRDISPDNVLIDQKGEPILIDFGAAREQASQKTRAMSALRVVKDGYSPQEFYIAGSEQGPWSDLYALGATICHLISGEAPANGQARLAALAEDKPDPYIALDGRFDGYPPGFLASVDKALCTLPRQRVQTADEWLAMFADGVAAPAPDADAIEAAVAAMVASSRIEPAPAADAAAEGTSGLDAPALFTRQVSQPQPATNTATRVSGRSGLPVQMMGGVAAALALVGVAIMLLGGEDAAAPATRTTDSAEATSAEPTVVANSAAALVPPTAEPVAEPVAATVADAPAAEAPAVTDSAAVAEEAAPAAITAAAEPALNDTPEDSPVDTAAVPAAPVAEPEAETEAVVAVAEPVVEPVVVEPVAAVAPEPVAEPLAEPVAQPAASQSAVPLLQNQIGFAAWDAVMPFVEDNRIINGQRFAVVLRVLPDTDLATVGSWLTNGLLLHSVNGVAVQQSGSMTAAVMNAMRVDPDGKARVVVEYSTASLEKQIGLMTVPATRLVSLANGVSVEARTVDGQWQVVVSGVANPDVTELQLGDVLFRDKTTGTAVDGPTSLETIMAALVETGVAETEFAIVRDNKLADATMQLAAKGGQ